jgi:hypothetical protein
MENEYRPVNIEFNVSPEGTEVPETFGEFNTPEEAAKFIGANFTALNYGVTVPRLMDAVEKKTKRDEYSDLLENIVPVYEKELSEAEQGLTNAKNLLKKAEEAYDFVIGKTKNLAAEVKRGLKDMTLDEKYTFRIPYKGRYYFFTYIDKQIRLCLIRDIAESEKSEIWNQMASNEEFIDNKVWLKKKGKK